MSRSNTKPQRSDSNGRSQNDDYDQRSRDRHEEYSTAYAQWIASLSPEERATVIAKGLDQPIHDTHRVSGHAPGEDRDAAESNRACVGFDFGALEHSSTGKAKASHGMSDEVLLTIQRVVGMLISDENPRISVTALAFALNLDALNGLGSIREAAKRIGVSPEAVSKKKRKWEADLCIPPNAFAKSKKAKLALSIAQQTKHWKHQKWKAPKPATPALPRKLSAS